VASEQALAHIAFDIKEVDADPCSVAGEVGAIPEPIAPSIVPYNVLFVAL
jgi:hypothetical protein